MWLRVVAIAIARVRSSAGGDARALIGEGQVGVAGGYVADAEGEDQALAVWVALHAEEEAILQAAQFGEGEGARGKDGLEFGESAAVGGSGAGEGGAAVIPVVSKRGVELGGEELHGRES